jgi:hypothetical protein
MRHLLCTALMLVNLCAHAQGPAIAESLESLHWMVGSWEGSLEAQTVEETWTSPSGGSMEAQVRLSNAEGVQLIEAIVIRETRTAAGGNELTLYLRQFSPTLELRHGQNMRLALISPDSISFAGGNSDPIQRLTYTSKPQGLMQAQVSFANGDVFTAHLKPR